MVFGCYFKNLAYVQASTAAQSYVYTGAEMFGLGDIWLETRVIIRISTHHCAEVGSAIFNSFSKKYFFKKGFL